MRLKDNTESEGVQEMMTEAIIVALITGTLTLVGTLAGVLASNKAHTAVVDAKLDELTREVRKHNEFAEKIPVIQNDIKTLYHQVNELKEK